MISLMVMVVVEDDVNGSWQGSRKKRKVVVGGGVWGARGGNT
jgi:hypothetical protein